MISFSFMTGKNRAIDFDFFHKYRSFRDGLSLFELNLESSWYRGDHNPQYLILLVILNFAIIDINWYNVNHVEQDEIDERSIVG